MSKPLAVLISDIHFNIKTLSKASDALLNTLLKADTLKVPLIIAGDTHDTKANMRAECVNELLWVMRHAQTEVFILIGNHDLINEREMGFHALDFLESENVKLVPHPIKIDRINLFPYFNNADELDRRLHSIPAGEIVIMHQGIHSADPGEYMRDPTALTKDAVSHLRVISGHYHRRQDIETGPPGNNNAGTFSYIGNPFTLSFGEANDPDKGYQILMDDGSLEFVALDYPKHVIVEIEDGVTAAHSYFLDAADYVWVKVKGTKAFLKTIDKKTVARDLGYRGEFKLDLIPTDKETKILKTAGLTQKEILDELIGAKSYPADTKEELKTLWRRL